MRLNNENGHINPAQIKVVEVKAMCDYKLLLRFDGGEVKVFDFLPLLSYPAFKPLEDPKVFNHVH